MTNLTSLATQIPANLAVKSAQESALNQVTSHLEAASETQNAHDKLWQAANGFEALFLQEFMKAGRQMALGDDLLGSIAVNSMQSLLDMEFSQLGGGARGLGIARAVYQQFATHLAPIAEAPPADDGNARR